MRADSAHVVLFGERFRYGFGLFIAIALNGDWLLRFNIGGRQEAPCVMLGYEWQGKERSVTFCGTGIRDPARQWVNEGK